jgi:protein TonB
VTAHVMAVREPRFSTGVIVSVLLHGLLIAAFVFLRAGAPPPSAPIYKVELIAAPAGERAIGVVRDQPQPTPPAPTPATPVTKTAVPRTKVPAPPKAKVKPTTAPVAATPTPPTKTATPPTTAPVAGGGPVGGKGADVANVSTSGIDFPYPWYTANITRQLLIAFGSSKIPATAEVRFIIKRDGSIDPESVHMVTPSNSYSFNQQVLGAVETVARGKLFGTLPPGFQEDILPVTFRFSPSLSR